MAVGNRAGALVILQAAVTGASPGLTVMNPGAEALVIEVSGTYSNLEASFEISIDGGVTFWPMAAVDLLTPGASGQKLTVPGLYRIEYGVRAMTHFRAPIATTGSPSGAMTIKVVGVFG